MDLYCSDKKLSELTDSPLGDFFDTDFTPPVSSMDTGFGLESGGSGDSDWLDTFFDDPVLNDRMISDALTPAPGQQQNNSGVQSEHSYSLHNHSDNDDDSNPATLDLSKSKHSVDVKDLDMELTGMNPNSMTLSSGHTTLSTTSGLRLTNASSAANDLYIKQEPLDLSLDAEMTTVTVTTTRSSSSHPQTLLKQPTIILATTNNNAGNNLATLRQERLVLPKVEIKMETSSSSQQQHHHHNTTTATTSSATQQRYTHSLIASPEHSTESFDSLSLPPTPPSSTNSDSDGGDRSPPCSPHRSSRHHHHRPTSPLVQQPFFMSPIPTSGVLMLTEEEKRTLISEGYPIPSKLPLTKQEEKNLKKIRRKIKNKISAQESRRKKKEYLETLERKVEAYSQENMDLKKKVDHLQNDNHSLLSQLHKLQASVRAFGNNTHSAGTCLMVLVLCFAVSLSAWSPMSLSMGYSTSVSSSLTASPSSSPSSSSSSSAAAMFPFSPSPDLLGALGGGMDSAVLGSAASVAASKRSIVHDGIQQPEDPSVTTYGPYATPNMRSRVLLGVEDEGDNDGGEFGPHAPFSYKWLLGGIFGGCAADPVLVPVQQSHQPTLPRVDVMDVETEINQTGGEAQAPPQAAAAAATTTSSNSRQPDMAVTTSSKPINATS